MKKDFTLSAIIAMLLGMVASIIMASCAGDSDRRLYAYVPDNSEMIMGADLEAIAKNGGCDVTDGTLELSPALKKIIGDDPRTLSILKAEGLDLTRVLLVMKSIEGTKGEDMFIVANVADNAKLDTYLTSNGMKKSSEKGMYVYTYENFCSVLVEGGVALYVPTGEDGVQVALDLRSQAVKFPIAQWKTDYMQSSTIAMLTDMEYLMDDVESVDYDKICKALGVNSIKGNKLAVNIDLKDTDLQSTSAILDNYGKKIDFDIEIGNVNTSLLKYTDAVDCAVLMFALPSKKFVSKILDAAGIPAIQKTAFLESYSYFKSAMVAAGPIDISDYRDTNSWHFVIAVEMQEGKSQDIYDLMKKTLPMMGVCPVADGDDMSFVLPAGLKGYIKKDGDNLVASIMLPITTDGASAITAADFGDYPAELVVKIPPHDAKTTLIDLPFGMDLKSYSSDSEQKNNLRLTDTTGSLLQNIIEVIASRK